MNLLVLANCNPGKIDLLSLTEVELDAYKSMIIMDILLDLVLD